MTTALLNPWARYDPGDVDGASLALVLRLARSTEPLVSYQSAHGPACFVNHPDLVDDVLAGPSFGQDGAAHPYGRLGEILPPVGAWALRLGGTTGQRSCVGDEGANEHVSRYARRISEALARQPGCPRYSTIKQVTLHSALELLIGRPATDWVSSNKDHLTEYAAAFDQVEASVAEQFTRGRAVGMTGGAAALARVADLTRQILVAAGEEEPSDDLIDALFRTIVNTYMGAATALSWTLLLLSHAPRVQQKVRREVSASPCSPGGSPADARALRYTLQVVQEALRLFPPAWHLSRITTADTVVAGRRFGSGVRFSVSAFAMHRHTGTWSHPDLFWPERFNVPDPSHKAFMAFGGGPRRCPSMHLAYLQLVSAVATVVGEHTLIASGRPVRVHARLALQPEELLPFCVHPIPHRR